MANKDVRRFCPFCAVGHNYTGDSPYTMWTTYMSGQGMCENDTGSWHKANMFWGKYGYDIGLMMAGGVPAIKRAVFTDDGIVCDGVKYYPKMFEATVSAMEAEAAAGIFEACLWKDTFPRRTAELLERMRRAVASAVGESLPPPLVGIIADYLWQS